MLPKIMPWLWRLADEEHNTFQASHKGCSSLPAAVRKNAWQAHANS